MSNVVSYQVVDNIGVISVNNPPVNALAQVVRAGILEAVTAAQNDATDALVLRCEGRTFIAGADITGIWQAAARPGFTRSARRHRKLD